MREGKDEIEEHEIMQSPEEKTITDYCLRKRICPNCGSMEGSKSYSLVTKEDEQDFYNFKATVFHSIQTCIKCGNPILESVDFKKVDECED